MSAVGVPGSNGVTQVTQACRSGRCAEDLELEVEALDRLMPMHLTVSMDGTIIRAAPSLRKLRSNSELAGESLFRIFEARRPRGLSSVADLLATEGGRLSLAFRDGVPSSFKGIAVPLPCSRGALINLSFGIAVVDAVHDYELTAGDFAPTDLAVEMLYLVEAKSAALHESKKLNLRLQGARVAAEEQAFTDTLTGLKNRRAMDHVLARLTAERIPFGLMNLDLDFFKDVNDTHGHAAGDEVLQTVARVLVCETRDVDTVIRVGGDEFVLIFRDLDNTRKLGDIAGRIIQRLEEPILYNDVYCRISGSIGIAVQPAGRSVALEALMEEADIALYASKRAGRGRFTVYSDNLAPAKT
jgi:diguanylate cyclase (GGDEF)-like protein